MAKKDKPTEFNLTQSLKKLSAIADWFDSREEVDVEEGLNKVKEAAVLIKASRSRLAEIENEFTEIKKDIESEVAPPPQEEIE